MTAPVPAVDLAGLLAERDRVESWLRALEGRREATPPAVFEKVQRDYTARLGTLTTQLRERDRDLAQEVARLAEALSVVENDQRTKQEARAEAELRHAVGEYTEAQWTTVAGESDVELTAIEARRVQYAREHQAALDLLTSVRRPTPTSTDMASAATDAPVAPVVSAAPAKPTVVPSTASAPAAPAAPASIVTSSPSGAQIKTPSGDELAFLSSLATDAARRSGAQAAVNASESAAPAPSRPSRPVEVAVAPVAEAPARTSAKLKLEPAPESRRTTIPAPLPPAAELTMPAEHAGLTEADVNVPRGSHTFATPAGDPRATAPRVTSRDSASILRRAQADQVKSLKCVECGTLNTPTEWYCEKCGAELSTL